MFRIFHDRFAKPQHGDPSFFRRRLEFSREYINWRTMERGNSAHTSGKLRAAKSFFTEQS
jgi:hypothetical protein